MPKNFETFLKRKSLKIILIGILVITLLGGLFLFLFFQATKEYRKPITLFSSPIGPSLELFIRNESQHKDSIPRCLYDSGDYLIFAHREALTLWYLSIAYEKAQGSDVKKDIKVVLDRQTPCLEKMWETQIKQFRDQKNHGINLPPSWNEILFPNNIHFFEPKEGKDVAALLSLIYRNLGDFEKSKKYEQAMDERTKKTHSSDCCESGPLEFPQGWIDGLSSLVEKTSFSTSETWGLQPQTFSILEQGKTDQIQGLLKQVNIEFDATGHPFDYLAGTTDIAGTIALERLYAQKTADNTFLPLSQKLMKYLEGENQYKTSFTSNTFVYHPCNFFFTCKLTHTLLNGIDENHTTDVSLLQKWRVFEPQITAQSVFVLAQVLLYNW